MQCTEPVFSQSIVSLHSIFVKQAEVVMLEQMSLLSADLNETQQGIMTYISRQ